MNRNVLWAVLVIGLALVIVPFAMGMPGKTAAGQRMLNDFRPLMQPAAVQKTAAYYDNVFTPLRPVAQALNADTVARFQGYGQGIAQMNVPAAMKQDFANLIGLMSQGTKVFAQVPGGLDWYKPLVTTMQGNVQDYKSVDSLPNFNLFTWFFVVPGALLMLLAGYGLWHEREVTVHRAHPTPA